VRETLIPFLVAFALCALLFLGLDLAILKLMGLSLVYHGS